MELVCRRHEPLSGATISELYEGGNFLCYILENTEKQIAGDRYRITITQSKRFNRQLPLINDVEGRSGIRIHPANWPHELEGCLAPGMAIAHEGNGVLESRTAFKKVYDLIDEALFKGDDVYIDVRNP